LTFGVGGFLLLAAILLLLHAKPEPAMALASVDRHEDFGTLCPALSMRSAAPEVTSIGRTLARLCDGV
jgi:hypothetical protein